MPANRIGHAVYSAAELKTMQEVITLAVFAGFSVFYLKEAITWNHVLGFVLIARRRRADIQGLACCPIAFAEKRQPRFGAMLIDIGRPQCWCR